MSSGYYSDELVFSTLHDTTGIPGARVAFGEDKPACPRFIYLLRDGGDMHADGSNYAAIPRYQARLYLAEYDHDTVEAFAGAVSELGLYAYSEEFEGTELVCIFDFTLTRGR